MVIEKLALEEFMKKYFPGGAGKVTVQKIVPTGEVHFVSETVFNKPICDNCNTELEQPIEEPEKKVVFVLDGAMALCGKCFSKVKPKE